MSFEARLAQAGQAIGATLATALDDLPVGPLCDAMRHATAGGKRLRGFLVLEGARLHGIEEAGAMPAAAAIEALHAYSLVHDDLPAMDDDDLRRGQPTVHMKWDEATAILTGDALQTIAFGLLAHPELGGGPAGRMALVARLAEAAGAAGMVLGQMQDIAAESAATSLTLDQIVALQGNKTGALIRWSAQAGPILAGDDPDPLGRYAAALGLAFQIADDVLDVEGTANATGKRVGKDSDQGKATFVGLLGLEGARARAQALVGEAEAALEPYGTDAETLKAAARFAITRDY